MDAISTHPQYTSTLSIWQQMRDTSAGEKAVKDATTTYLPKTEGQAADKVNGQTSYDNYLARATWYDFLGNTIRDSIGLLHRERATVTLPPSLDGYLDNATDDGDSINMLLRRINEQQLITGRGGLLLDPEEDLDYPRTSLWSAERIVNWDSDHPVPTWIVLDDSSYVVDITSMSWKWTIKYRLLALDSQGRYFTRTFETWNPALLADPSEDEQDVIYPMFRGRTLDRIPFTFFNSSNLLPDVELPPLLPLSNACLSIYKGEADYRQALHMQGFAVMFLKGFNTDELGDIRVGSGNYISATSGDADASFLEVAGSGLSSMRDAQNDLKNYASDLGIELKEQTTAESGKALSTRLTIRTASLETLAVTAAWAVSQQISLAMEWMGVSGDYSVEPNLDFIEQNESADELLKMKDAFDRGAISDVDYWSWLRSKDFTRMTLEEFRQAVQLSNADEAGLSLEERIQKIYLGVGSVITAEEAREILRESGADLSEGVDPSSGE